METQFKQLLDNYQHNFTNVDHHSSIQNLMKNFEVTQLISFCENEISSKKIVETNLNTEFLMKLLDYSARTDSYFEEQRNRLLNYSLAIGGFATTYITTMVSAFNQEYINRALYNTCIGFAIVLLGCIIAWIIYILSFSPSFPHRKKSYSPFFFSYNVCSKFSFLSLSFIPQNKTKKEEALKAFHLDLTTYVNRINNITSDYSTTYKTTLTQIVMLFRTSQHKSTSSDLMRTVLSITFSTGLIIYFILLIFSIL